MLATEGNAADRGGHHVRDDGRAQPPSGSCADGWDVSTIVGGVGNLENLDTDGSGGFYVTGIVDGYLAHIDAAGRFEKLVTGLDHPAGVQTRSDPQPAGRRDLRADRSRR
ncbi:hypothetical protein ACQPXH_08640 [Nocardia sp. CA-135953]|uniref:hypothetical protein n=1 Tax=Nocardia sp. CA-135953 TaxID=3239978 RepID=UPI003D97DD59